MDSSDDWAGLQGARSYGVSYRIVGNPVRAEAASVIRPQFARHPPGTASAGRF